MYVGGLGLYSDDWAFLASLFRAQDQSLSGLTSHMLAELPTRPVQAVLLAGLYWLFGLEPVGYHLANAAIFSLTILLFYLALRELRVSRVLALSLPLVFCLLPHYSTDRFWIAAFQANASVGLYFLALYADLRAVRARRRAQWGLKLLAVGALLGSVLAYEMVAPFFILNVVLLWYHDRQLRRVGVHTRQSSKLILLWGGLNILALMSVVAYKMTTTDRAGMDLAILWNLKRVVKGGLSVHYGEYGIGLPVKVGQAISSYSNSWLTLLSAVIVVLVFVYLRSVARHSDHNFTNWLKLFLTGCIVWGAGYAVALLTYDIGFSTTGINNRTAIAAAVGVALTFVAVIGGVSRFFPSLPARQLSFCALTALLCGSGFLLNNTIATFWVAAARQQQQIIHFIQDRPPPSGSTLLIDGICPYQGPGIIFETNWDVSGMLQIYFDATLSGDVVKRNLEIREDGIRTTLYDDVINDYPYGDKLFVYHVKREEVISLDSEERARAHFSSSPTERCPPGREGQGSPIF